MNQNSNGIVRTEREGSTLIIEVDRQDKMNGFTPEMFEGITTALELLEQDSELWVGVLCFAGEHTTSGLDLPRFFGPNFDSDKDSSVNENRPDAFALKRRCAKPIVAAVQGITYTLSLIHI